MESFFRYISYADYYENGLRLHNGGFLRWRMQKGLHRIEIEVKDLHQIYGKFLVTEEKTKEVVAPIELNKGQGSLILSVKSVNQSGKEYLPVTNGQLDLAEIKAFRIELGQQRILRIPIELPLETKMEAAQLSSPLIAGIEEKYESGYEEDPKEDQKEEIPTPFKEEKWQQLCSHYPQVQPFNSGKRFLSIRPEDFIILQEQYQKLVQNSFLLHGYYNYGHMILGKLEEGKEAPYYIGVPGVFYEKERQAAGLFGFVGFEGVELPVKNGSYGYYMIEVKL